MFRKKSRTSEVKQRARRTLGGKLCFEKQTYVIDTSAIINRALGRLIRRGLKGKIIIPNASMAELENLANKGIEEGFIGLEEIAKLHRLKKYFPIEIFFYGIRPSEHHIKYAKSGEIDALIREIAITKKAVLITSDLVQAKSAQAYGINVLFLRSQIKKPKKKKRFFLFRKK